MAESIKKNRTVIIYVMKGCSQDAVQGCDVMELFPLH